MIQVQRLEVGQAVEDPGRERSKSVEAEAEDSQIDEAVKNARWKGVEAVVAEA